MTPRYSTVYDNKTLRQRVAVTVTESKASRTLTFEVIYYAYWFADAEFDRLLKQEITSSMSDLDKVKTIATICTRDFDYDAKYQSWAQMILYGGGDCWACTNFMVEGCRRVGIKAGIRNGRLDSYSDTHRNAIVEIGDELYVVDASYPGKRPRTYVIGKNRRIRVRLGYRR